MSRNEDDIEDEGDPYYATSADIDGDDDDEVVKSVRRIRVEFKGYLEVDVIEPPQVFEAEIKAGVKRAMINAMVAHKLGVPVGYGFEVTN